MKTTQETKPRKSKNKGGRPPEFTEDVVKKLEESFSIDATVEEACFYANISRQCYYDNVKEGSELFDRFKALRERPVLLARQTAVKRIPESYSNAMDYLKRKKKLEFGDSSEVTIRTPKPLLDVLHNTSNEEDSQVKTKD